MTTSKSKGRFFYKTNRFESIRITNRIESIRIANWNALVLTNANLARTQEEIFQHNFCKKTWALTPVSIICRHPISVGPKMNSCIVNAQSLSAHQLTVTRSINRTAYTAVKIKMAMLLTAVHTIRTYPYSIPLRSDPHNSRCERASLVRLRWSVNPVLRSQLSNYRIPRQSVKVMPLFTLGNGTVSLRWCRSPVSLQKGQ